MVKGTAVQSLRRNEQTQTWVCGATEVSSALHLLLVFQGFRTWPPRGPVWPSSHGRHRQAWDGECPFLPEAQAHEPLSALAGAEEDFDDIWVEKGTKDSSTVQ